MKANSMEAIEFWVSNAW